MSAEPLAPSVRVAPARPAARARLLGALRRDKAAALGLILLLAIALASLVGPLLTPYDPNGVDLAVANQPPSLGHPMGTDQFGQDILTRLLVAGRLDLLIAITSVALSMVVGVALGALAGGAGRAAARPTRRSCARRTSCRRSPASCSRWRSPGRSAPACCR